MNPRHRSRFFVPAVLLFMSSPLCAVYEVGDRVADFSWEHSNGVDTRGATSIHELLNEQKAIVLEWSQAWCQQCWLAAPHLQEIWEAYGGLGNDALYMCAALTENADHSALTWDQLNGSAWRSPHACTHWLALDELYDRGITDFGITGVPSAAVIGAFGRLIYLGQPTAAGFQPAIAEAIASFKTISIVNPIQSRNLVYGEVITLDVSEVYGHGEGTSVSVALASNANDSIAGADLEGTTLTITAYDLDGNTDITLRATADGDKMDHTFNVSVHDPTLHEVRFDLFDSYSDGWAYQGDENYIEFQGETITCQGNNATFIYFLADGVYPYSYHANDGFGEENTWTITVDGLEVQTGQGTGANGSVNYELVIGTVPGHPAPTAVEVNPATGVMTWRAPGSVRSILLVDDAGPYENNESPRLRHIYTDALEATGFDYDVAATTDGVANHLSVTDMDAYDLVIWFTGDMGGDGATLAPADEAGLGDYLDKGGRLMLFGQDYLLGRYPLAGTFSGDEFPLAYLGVKSVTQNAWINESNEWEGGEIIGIEGAVTDGMSFQVFDPFPESTGISADDLVTNGTTLLETDQGGVLAVHYSNAIFSTCTLAALTEGANTRADLLTAFINLLATPPAREVVNYSVYLDDMTTVLANVSMTKYLFSDLTVGQDYVAGVSARYVNAYESDVYPVSFTYMPDPNLHRVTFDLFDSYGDGWAYLGEENYIEFNGGTLTCAAEHASFTYFLTDGVYPYTYHENDDFGNENSWIITIDGQEVQTGKGLGNNGITSYQLVIGTPAEEVH